MDLFQFTEALRRQKWLLIIGAVLVVGVVAFLGLDFDDGIGFRAKPRYESSIQLAVVPADFDSLASTLPNSGALAGTASLYATLLSTPEAAIEISEQTGVHLLETLMVITTGRDGFIGVKATARDAEEARRAALYSFTWLEQRLVDPLTIVRPEIPVVQEAAPSILDENGQFVGAIRLQASPAFAETATGLWIGLTTADSVVTTSLADAAGQLSEHIAPLKPDSDIVVSLEDVFGNALDAISLHIPALPGRSTVQYALIVRLDRGMLFYPQASTQTGADDGGLAILSTPELVERHIDLSWQQTVPAFGPEQETTASDAVGLILLTESPSAFVTGTRRGPVLIIAALVGGILALLALAITVDAWSRARREGKAEQVGEHSEAGLLSIDGPRRAGKR